MAHHSGQNLLEMFQVVWSFNETKSKKTSKTEPCATTASALHAKKVNDYGNHAYFDHCTNKVKTKMLD